MKSLAEIKERITNLQEMKQMFVEDFGTARTHAEAESIRKDIIENLMKISVLKWVLNKSKTRPDPMKEVLQVLSQLIVTVAAGGTCASIVINNNFQWWAWMVSILIVIAIAVVLYTSTSKNNEL